jgi:hypothetical protein
METNLKEEKINLAKNPKEEKKSNKKGIFIFLIALLALGNGAFVWLWLQERERANTEVIVKEQVIVERDNVKVDLLDLQDQYATLQTNDKAIQADIDAKRVEIAGLLEQAELHKNDAAIIAKLRYETTTLRRIMKHYIIEIDSLNTLNKTITAEKDKVSEDLNSEKSITSQLNKDKSALQNTVDLAAALKATGPKAEGVKFKSGGKKESETNKASRVEKIKVSFVLSENKIAKAGIRPIYVRIVSPDGKEITKSPDDANMFNFNGSKGYFAGRKEINYKNTQLGVDIFCGSPTGFIPGKYLIDIACDDAIIGQTNIILK